MDALLKNIMSNREIPSCMRSVLAEMLRRIESLENNAISPAAILGKEGGKKSKRVLTPEQAKAMVEAREKKKRGKG